MKSVLLRHDFPILQTRMQGKPLVYLDNAATTQKPQQVIDAISTFYSRYNAPVYRSVYDLGEQATQLYENARAAVASHLHARIPQEIIFTAGATAGINMVAATWGEQHIHEGDEIILTELEHHANLIPWQELARKKKAFLRFVPVRADGTLVYEALESLVSSKTKLIACTALSNMLGTSVDVRRMVQAARLCGARILVDAAQAVPHHAIDVQALDVDFLVFSGHKMLAPTAIGVLYIKEELHRSMPPYHVGGGMVFNVSWHDAQWLQAPHKFEAGTLPVAQAVGLHAALDYFNTHVTYAWIAERTASLCSRLVAGLQHMPRVTIVGPVQELMVRGHLVSFIVDGIHAHDVATYLASKGICVRAGHHCAQPLAHTLRAEASVRVSFYCYNTIEEVDYLLHCLQELC